MTSLAALFTRPRKSYQKIKPAIEHPYLIEIQQRSYEKFLQRDVDPQKRENIGLQAVFNSVFPVKDFAETARVEFVSYSFDEPKYTVGECRQRGMSYAAPFKVIIRLVIWDTDKDTNAKSVRDVKEQEVYFGEIPLMTENGTFIINGTERVVVSQLHRSAGVFFDHDKGKNSSIGKILYTARVIPYRGSWIDFEFDIKDILYVRIDRRRKMHATILLKALGYSEQDLLNHFYRTDLVLIDSKGKLCVEMNYAVLRGQRASYDIADPKSGKVFVKKNRRISAGAIRQMEAAGLTHQQVHDDYLVGKVVSENVLNSDGEVLIPLNTELTKEDVQKLVEEKVKQVHILFIDGVNVDSSFRDTLLGDKVESREDALLEIYRRLRPGDPPTLEPAETLLNNLFFNSERYDLSAVGRLKLNERLGNDEPLDQRTLTKKDILAVVHYLLKLKTGQGEIDDIDHLGNRRVRAVGELLENQYRIGLLRIERAIRERLQLQDVDTLLPHDLINNKPASAVVKEFFGSSQLSQFMDQTNPLSEVTHKRRLSALGPGGLSRDRAGFEVRDVHATHYGRICPVETPEGPNIGLISSLASYARVNEFGFIETPYKIFEEDAVKYLTASEEHTDHVIVQASDAERVGGGESEYVSVRRRGEPEIVTADEVDMADVSTTQLVSVAANLIPFLQNDDANRALMGSNMMRQAVPLIKTSAPLVGTGMEKTVARDSGATVVVKRDGVIASVDADRIVVKVDRDEKESVTEVGTDVDIYTLKKYTRSNLDTCINQKPIVKVGERVKRSDIIADGFATEMGELALGQNVTVAFMPWNGYNFEDSILISERVVKEDLYTSVHIQEFECISRDTKLGQEEITGDIPNVGEEALANLDEAGIIRIGAEVKPGDILVGKITPKGETQLSPDEKLLRAIFGEKAGDVRDTSLRVPPGVEGTIIGCKVFSREGAEKDIRSNQIEETEAAKIRKDERDTIHIIKASALRKILSISASTKLAKDIKSKEGELVLSKGTVLTQELLENIHYLSWYDLSLADAEAGKLLSKVLLNLKEKISQVKSISDLQLKKLSKGDELPPGVIKMVKIYVAIKRKLRVGDKMAGRHGNKGVISRILPEQDMPFTADGVPVDLVLNPLGVPSRMNVGQILETHLGWAAKHLGKQLNKVVEEAYNRAELEKFILKVWESDDDVGKDIETFLKSCSDEELKDFVRKYKEGIYVSNPVFDGANESEIGNSLSLAGVENTGQTELYDGLTGERFHNKVTVGVMYMMKLHHLVDEKIHARSIGPYSLVTQQPLGGKAQFGGQRLGEMEVWAMEAYGAAYTLQEMLTVKSDDVTGRTRMYESIVKGANMTAPGLPESFNVLIKELQSLALDVNLLKEDGQVFIPESFN